MVRHLELFFTGTATFFRWQPISAVSSRSHCIHCNKGLAGDLRRPGNTTGVAVTASKMPETVLFACVHNAGRSQMSAAWFDALADPELARAASAGSVPGSHVHPEVLEAMKEVGIDLSDKKPQLLTKELAETSALLVTMGCGEACPYVPGLERLDWQLKDPKGQSVETVRVIRDDVKNRIQQLVNERGWAKPEASVVAAEIPQ